MTMDRLTSQLRDAFAHVASRKTPQCSTRTTRDADVPSPDVPGVQTSLALKETLSKGSTAENSPCANSKRSSSQDNGCLAANANCDTDCYGPRDSEEGAAVCSETRSENCPGNCHGGHSRTMDTCLSVKNSIENGDSESYVGRFRSSSGAGDVDGECSGENNPKSSDCDRKSSVHSMDKTVVKSNVTKTTHGLDTDIKPETGSETDPGHVVTVEWMVHPGFRSDPRDEACGAGADHFACSPAREHELEILTSPELRLWMEEEGIVLTHSCVE